ncbi:hypothetical protein BGZ46_002725 [Entomortierella lignicola]|nr:hypothetical protein BGZ46_002725 [Entomortierella lignicola]
MKEAGERSGSAPAVATPTTTTATATTTTTTGKRPYHRKQPLPFRKDPNNINGTLQHNKDPHGGLTLYSSHQHQRDPSTLDNFCHSMLRISSLHILQSAGYDAVQANPISVLADCLGRYLTFLAEAAKDFAEHSGRTQITAFDVLHGLSEIGINLSDLKDWAIENGGESFMASTSTTESAKGASGINGTETNTAGSNAGNKPVFPTWKGADPGRAINDVLWNGRKRDTDNKDIYEWRAVPEGFSMPETEEEQDEYAYPEASDDEIDRDKDMEPVFNVGRSKWIPELKPQYIPDYMPPFPGAALPEEEADGDEEYDQSIGIKKSHSTENFNDTASPAHLVSAIVPEPTVASVSRNGGDGKVNPDLSKLSISTSQLTVDNANQTTAKPIETEKRADINPYTHVVPFLESSLPFSTLYSAIPTKSNYKSTQIPRPKPGLSQDTQQLFSDALFTVMDPTPYPPTFSKRLRRQSKLAHMIAKPAATSDTLFSNSQQPGIIDTQLRLSLPHTITQKFMNPGVSVNDSPSDVPENVTNGGYSDYYSQEPTSAIGSRSTIMPTGSRKSSFSHSPLSTVTYPPTVLSNNNGQLTNLSGSMVKTKPSSRKTSITGFESNAPSPTPFQPTAPASLAPQQPGTGITASVSNSGIKSSAPINPSILSRIGSNFDPVALLAAQGPSTPNNHTPTGDSQVIGQSTLTSSGPTPSLQAVSSGTPVALSNYNGSVPSNTTGVTSTPISSSTHIQPPARPIPASRPIPGPISLSELPLAMPTGSATSITPSSATSTTSQATPKIRFKFSAMDAITSPTGDHDGSSSALAIKRDYGQHSSSTNSGGHHHHRSSSISSTTGSSHHKKSKKSSREYDFDDEDEDEDEEGRLREKKKKKKSKSKDKDRDRDHRDRDRDRDSDGDGSSSRHKHKSHPNHRYEGSSKTGSYTTSSGYSQSSSSHGAGYQAKADGVEVIDCICSNPTLDDGLFMIACDKCEVWFHGRCVGVRESDNVGTWYCQRCTLTNRV